MRTRRRGRRSGPAMAWLLAVATAGTVALMAIAGPARAEPPTEGLIVSALTRASGAADGNWTMDDVRLVDRLRRTATRPLNPREREGIRRIAAKRPSIDLEVNFGSGSAVLAPDAVPVLVTLGRALTDPRLKGDLILIAGHADAASGARSDLRLAQRRANTVRRFLIANFDLPPDALVTIGFGSRPSGSRTDLQEPVEIVRLAGKRGRAR